MPVRIPNLSGSACDQFSVCAAVKTRDSQLAKRLKTKARAVKVASLRMPGGSYRVRLVTGGSFDGHLHLDVLPTNSKLLAGRKTPKATHGMRELQEDLESFIGSTIEAAAEGTFLVQPQQVPKIVEVASAPTVVGSITVRMTAGILSVDGAPINVVRWMMRKDGQEVMIEVRTKTESVVLSESYLEDLWQRIQSGFAAVACGGAPNAPGAQ